MYFVADCSPGRHVKSLFVVGEAGTNDYTNALFQGKTVKEIKSKLMPQVVRAIMRAVRVSCFDSNASFEH